ncbi:MAG: hypothetical protein ACK559_06065, partial [bacterium]
TSGTGLNPDAGLRQLNTGRNADAGLTFLWQSGVLAFTYDFQYQKARITFVQNVAELATRPQNIEALNSAGVMLLLRPLLLDSVSSIQQSAALAIGRLANHSEDLAESVIQND